MKVSSAIKNRWFPSISDSQVLWEDKYLTLTHIFTVELRGGP
jgi:hypothetical protein